MSHLLFAVLGAPHEKRPTIGLMKIFVLLILLLLAHRTRAEEATAAGGSAESALLTIQRQLQESEAAYQSALSALAPGREAADQGQRLTTELRKNQADLFMSAVALAKSNPKSAAGFAALEWILKDVRSYYHPAGALAFELLASEYANRPAIGRSIAVLAYYLPPEDEASCKPAVQLLKAVAEKNGDRTAQGQALLGLARVAKRKFEEAEYAGTLETNSLAAEAERAFEAVVRDCGECANLRDVGVRSPKKTLGEEAEVELQELRYLRIGQRSPEIEGEDLHGSRMKLSAYRGKVVLLVFWASWCGPCMADVPHEKVLVERFKNRPFVLVGVNGDASKKEALEAVAAEQIPWRSFWNGKDGPNGPVAATFNVRAWPTVYVLDHHGVIRHKHARGKQLDAPLEKLVSAAEKP